MSIILSLCCSFARHEIESEFENSRIDSKLKVKEPIDTFMNKVVENRIKMRIYHVINCMLLPRASDLLIKGILNGIPDANSLASSLEYNSTNKPYIKAEKIYADIKDTYTSWKNKKIDSSFDQFLKEKIFEESAWKSLYDVSIEICAKVMSTFFAKDISSKKNRYNMQTVNHWIKQKGYKNMLEMQIVLVNTMIPEIIRDIQNNVNF